MKFWSKLCALFRKGKLEDEMSEEVRLHLELQTERNVAAGMSDAEARYAARRQFGGVEQVKERCREQRSWLWYEQFLQDARYGFRSLRRNPGFATVVIVTLGIGIGATTTIFSVVNGVLLKPLAYREPERLVTLLHDGQWPVAPADFLDWRTQAKGFEILAAAEVGGGILLEGERPENVPGIKLGEGMFETFGVRPLLGRTFQPSDFMPGAERTMVLGYELWMRRFGGEPGVIGRTVGLSGETRTVIGVMPPDFQFVPFWATRAELATPLDLASRATSRGANSLRVFGRLKDGVSREQAQSEMNTICRQLEQTYPETNTGRRVRVDALIEKVVGDVRASLRTLAGAVGFVLLIACANVANLLLARSTVRQKEMAVRAALGASRGRTLRQMLAESAVFAMAGGVLGLALSYIGVAAIKASLAGGGAVSRARLPRAAEIAVDGSTLLFTLSIALLTVLAFGLVPAWQTARFAQRDALQEGGGRGTTGGRRGQSARGALVVAQIALALITLVGAGLMLRSFLRLAGVDAGFDARNALSLIVSLQGQPDMVDERRESFYRQLTEKIGALPGVLDVGAVNHLPVAGDLWAFGVGIEGRPIPAAGQGLVATYRVSLPGYFRAMGISLVGGRDFAETDAVDSPGVAIINERFADRHWPGGNALDQRITVDDPSGAPKWLTIVGIVQNVTQRNWAQEVGEEVYLPFAQTPFRSDSAPHHAAMTLVIRAGVDPATLIRPVQATIWSLDGSTPISGVATLEQVVAGAVWQSRFNVILTGLFAGVALVLAAIGLYGVAAYNVAQRTREFGVRLALGASSGEILGLVLRRGMALVAMGLTLGVLGALGLTRLLASVLYEVKPNDPWTFFAMTFVLLVVGVLACWLPARRAAKVNPMVALRAE